MVSWAMDRLLVHVVYGVRYYSFGTGAKVDQAF